jgi:hypothetical protein
MLLRPAGKFIGIGPGPKLLRLMMIFPGRKFYLQSLKPLDRAKLDNLHKILILISLFIHLLTLPGLFSKGVPV